MAVYQFGPFTLEVESAELSRWGRRVPLRPQPCLALAHLVARHGQFVSRRELYDRLWPDGIFVQFDDGLNSCIKQIRAALGDSRVRPYYVETLTRRGYRFIAPVTELADPALGAATSELRRIHAGTSALSFDRPDEPAATIRL